MRVLHVVEATVAGVRRHVHTLVCGLDRERFAVTVACPLQRDEAFGETQFVHDLEHAGVPVVALPLRRAIHPASDSAALRQLVALIRDGTYDIVHAHSSKAGFLARLAARIAGTAKTVYTPHGLYFTGVRSPLKRRFYLALEQLAGRLGDCVVAVSPGEYALLRHYRIAPPSKLVCIELGIAPIRLPDDYNRAAERRALGQPGDGPLIGCVGRLTSQKNPLLFVEAARATLRDLPDARFVWCGGGELRAEAEAHAHALGVAQACHFTGHREDAHNVIAALDLFWLPSCYEGLPTVVLEAMALDVPVVATDVVGSRDVLRGRAGILVPLDDPAAFARASLLITQQPALRAAFVQAGTFYYCERGTAARMVRETEHMYTALMSESAPAARRAAHREPAQL